MSDPKENTEADKVEQAEQETSNVEEQTANTLAVEDEQSVEDEVADLDVDEDEDEDEYTEDPEEEIEDEDEDEYEPDPDKPEAA